ncbi:MAG: DUF3108 domain-containing protein [Burkholderiaceae bacterium]|nr:DUF3108 domain-containing protein [Burkholderiaceae bacterium]
MSLQTALAAPPESVARLARGGPDARALLGIFLLALLLHALALVWLGGLLQAPSQLEAMAPTFYTRAIVPQAPAAPPEATAATAARPAAQSAPGVVSARKVAAGDGKTPTPPPAPRQRASAPAPNHASAPAPQRAAGGLAPDGAASAPAAVTSAAAAAVAASQPADADVHADAGEDATRAPLAAASAPAATDEETLASWPGDTRLTYKLGGYYRGELNGDAQVLWQRDGARYQAVVQLDVGFLLSTRLTSQGQITPAGLWPEVYEEQVRKKLRGVRLDTEYVRLTNGERVARPADVQDTASQFVELGHRFATGQIRLEAGGQVDFWLARPRGVELWTYDVLREETLYLPRLGSVQAFHLKPRPLDKPGGSITAEIWFAPSLQYLPVRIRLNQGEDTYMDLLVDKIEQRQENPD